MKTRITRLVAALAMLTAASGIALAAPANASIMRRPDPCPVEPVTPGVPIQAGCKCPIEPVTPGVPLQRGCHHHHHKH